MRHRALGFPGAQGGPSFALVWVVGAVDIGELSDRRALGDAVEHAAGADRGELLAVADGDQLCSRALHKLREGVEALVVDHPGLVEEHGRVLADAHGACVCASDQCVQGERASGKRGAVRAESLGGGARYGHADGVAAGELLCACGCVDHDALAGPGGANEHRDSLRPRQCSQRPLLLRAQMSGDPLGDLLCGLGSGGVAHIPPGRLGKHGDPSLDRLLLGADGEGCHPSAFQAEDSAVTNHCPRDPERLIR